MGVGFQRDASGDRLDFDLAQNLAAVGVDGEEFVGGGGGGDERLFIGTQFDGEWGGVGFIALRLIGRQRFEVEEAWFFGGVLLEIDAGDLVEEGTVFEFGEAVLLGAGASVGVVTRIDLGDEDGAFGIDGESEEKRAESVDRFHELVGFGVVNEEVFVRNAGMFDDVDDVAE